MTDSSRLERAASRTPRTRDHELRPKRHDLQRSRPLLSTRTRYLVRRRSRFGAFFEASRPSTGVLPRSPCSRCHRRTASLARRVDISATTQALVAEGHQERQLIAGRYRLAPLPLGDATTPGWRAPDETTPPGASIETLP